MTKDQLFAFAQHITPQKTLSRAIGKIAECENTWVKNTFISQFVKKYQVDMTEAVNSDPLSYRNFNNFLPAPFAPNYALFVMKKTALPAQPMALLANLATLSMAHCFRPKVIITA